MWASGHNGEIRRAAHGYERRHDASVFLYAFDLIELNGDDLIRDPLEVPTRAPPGGCLPRIVVDARYGPQESFPYRPFPHWFGPFRDSAD
jgi:hypothetical protein